MGWLKNWFVAKRQAFGWYHIDEVQAGGHCGLCGAWVPDHVLPKSWPWTICKKCEVPNENRTPRRTQPAGVWA
jgi:hypothetical protein